MRYVFGDYTLDTERYELYRTGVRLRIEPRVFDLLAYLVQHPGHTVTKDVLCTELWPDQPSVSDGSLTNCVAQVRKVLGDTGQGQQYIQTVYGRGYRFIASVAIRQQTEMDAPNPPAEALPILTEQHGLNQADGGLPPHKRQDTL